MPKTGQILEAKITSIKCAVSGIKLSWATDRPAPEICWNQKTSIILQSTIYKEASVILWLATVEYNASAISNSTINKCLMSSCS